MLAEFFAAVVPIAVVAPTVYEVMTRALDRAHYGQKALAVDMGISEPVLSRCLTDEKHLSLNRLLRAEPRMLRAFALELLEQAGGEPPVTRSVLREELDRVGLRMLRAAWPSRNEGVA